MEQLDRTNDAVELCGEIVGKPELSHVARDEEYFKFPMAIERLSGTLDIVNVVVNRQMMENLEINQLPRLRVLGEVRSFNNRSGIGPRLVITVLARHMEFTDEDYANSVRITGSLCKDPNLRRTPMGREICDMMIAVNRPYGRSDYLPCIAWGAIAREAACWHVGDQVNLSGRLQSRTYIKLLDGQAVEKTAYEISVTTLSRLEDA